MRKENWPSVTWLSTESTRHTTRYAPGPSGGTDTRSSARLASSTPPSPRSARWPAASSTCTRLYAGSSAPVNHRRTCDGALFTLTPARGSVRSSTPWAPAAAAPSASKHAATARRRIMSALYLTSEQAACALLLVAVTSCYDDRPMIIRVWRRHAAAVLCALLWSASAWAQEPQAPPTEPIPVLPPIRVTAPPPVASSSEQIIPGRDFELRPQGRPADILRLVPGLSINQHQGGGKAERYLIRGFDADHGTDLAIFVDGLPVNLRSHAHGQGYADLHFLIPETVKAVDVLKGPYFPEYGDFDTAGAVVFLTRDYVEENTLEVAGGSFNTQRYLALLSPTRDALKTFIAVEGYRSDGPFEHPNGYVRFNIFAKATASLAQDMTLSVWASHYRAEGHGSGQLPSRAIRAGLIDGVGAIDPNGPAVTQRPSLTIDYAWRVGAAQRLTAHAYASYYALSLFNDFTFFLKDPEHSDMINQRDRRIVAGFDTQYEIKSLPLGMPLTSTAGFQYRIDTPHIVLANAIQRHQVARVQDVSIVEQSYSPFVKFELVPLDKVRLVTGARGDIFLFHGTEHVDTSEPFQTREVTKARPNVKANLILGPWLDTEFFANFGTGFHSNDARAVLTNTKLEALPTAT